MEREEAAITVLQAQARGLLVRRRLRRLLRDYESVVRDIEGEHAAVHWGRGLLCTPHIIPQVPQGEAAKADGRHGGQLFSNKHKASVTCRNDGKSEQASINELCVPATGDIKSSHPLPETVDIHKTSDQYLQTLSKCVLPEKKGLLSETNPTATEELLSPAYHPDSNGIGEEETVAVIHTLNIVPERESHLPEENMPEKEHLPKNSLCPYSDITGHPDQKLDSLECSSVWSDKTLDTDLPSDNVTDLQKLKSHLAMEMLWVQQAIASRKNYLMVRQHLGIQD